MAENAGAGGTYVWSDAARCPSPFTIDNKVPVGVIEHSAVSPISPPLLTGARPRIQKPTVGFEPTTPGLQNQSSTVELRWRNCFWLLQLNWCELSHPTCCGGWVLNIGIREHILKAQGRLYLNMLSISRPNVEESSLWLGRRSRKSLQRRIASAVDDVPEYA